MSTTIRDVAEAAGVSTATVSRALRHLPLVSETTRQAVAEAADRLGFTLSPAAAAVATGRQQAMTLIVPSLGTWFSTEVFTGAARELRQANYDLFLIDLAACPTGRDQIFHNRLLRRRADAVIALDVDFQLEERRQLQSLAMPAIVVGGAVEGVSSIGLDDASASRLAMGHLLVLGHRRIGHVSGSPAFGTTIEHTEARKLGWVDALRTAGVRPLQRWLISGDFRMPHATAAARVLLERPDRPTAVFAASDEMAFGVLEAARHLGLRVPEDLSIVGIDDHAWSASFGLTTVAQRPDAFGQAAARVLLDELDGVPHAVERMEMPGELVVRGSTAPPSIS